jgi:hypothetical protein
MTDAVRGSPVLCAAQPRVLGRVHTGSLKGDGCKLSTSRIPAAPFLTTPPIKAPRRTLCNPITCWLLECVGICSACMHIWSDCPQFCWRGAAPALLIATELHEIFSWVQEHDRGSKGSGLVAVGAGLPHHVEKADVRPDRSFLPDSYIIHPTSRSQSCCGVGYAQVHGLSNNLEITADHDKDWRREVTQPFGGCIED